MLSKEEQSVVRKNRRYKEKLKWTENEVNRLIKTDEFYSYDTKDFIDAVKRFQRKHGLEEDGIVGPNTYNRMKYEAMSPVDKAYYKVIYPTTIKESAGKVDAVNEDTEYESIKWHKCYKHGPTPCHIGASCGVAQASQDSGAFGGFVKKCFDHDPVLAKSIIGPTWAEFLSVVTAPGPSAFSQLKEKWEEKRKVGDTTPLRGNRVQPIPIYTEEGELIYEDIWKEPWLSRIKRLLREFEQQQYEFFIEDYLLPVLPMLKHLGMLSELSVAMAYSACIHRGVDGGKNYILRWMKKGCNDRFFVEAIKDTGRRYRHVYATDGLTYDKWSGWDVIDVPEISAADLRRIKRKLK